MGFSEAFNRTEHRISALKAIEFAGSPYSRVLRDRSFIDTKSKFLTS